MRRVTIEAGRDAGQTTAEYALVVLVAAAVAGMALVWVTRGGLDVVFEFVTENLLGYFDRG